MSYAETVQKTSSIVSGPGVSSISQILVLQQGRLTMGANTPISIPCPVILNSDEVFIGTGVSTADGVISTVITQGTGFVVTPNTFRGLVPYYVCRSNALNIDGTT